MIELTPKQEYEALEAGEDIVHIGICGKLPQAMHAGHTHLVEQTKILYPTSKLLIRVFSESGKMHNLFFNNPKANNFETNYDYIKSWAEGAGADYITNFAQTPNQKKHINRYDAYLATLLPQYTTKIKYKQGYDNLLQRALTIHKADELNIYHDSYVTWKIIIYIMAALYTGVSYPRKVGSLKGHDMWLAKAKEYIHATYGGTEYISIPSLKDENGYDVNSHGTGKIPGNWKNRKGCIKYQPKWLGNKTYYEWPLSIGKGTTMRHAEII